MLRQLLLLLLPVLWMGLPILATRAVNKLVFLYDEPSHKIGFELKKRTWGPSYRDTKKVVKSTSDEFIRKKAEEAVRLWKMGFYSFGSALVLWVIIVLLDG